MKSNYGSKKKKPCCNGCGKRKAKPAPKRKVKR